MFEQAFRNIDDALRKEAGCATELDYAEQTSWLLFLKYLDGLEQDRATEAQLEGKKYTCLLDKPYRWDVWAAPKDKSGQLDHNTALSGDDLAEFVKLQQTFADSPKSWSVDAKAIDPATFDLSVKNPNGGETVTHRRPQEIMEEITALDAESAEVLENIRRLL
jgi:type I restriction enzyme M protein